MHDCPLIRLINKLNRSYKLKLKTSIKLYNIWNISKNLYMNMIMNNIRIYYINIFGKLMFDMVKIFFSSICLSKHVYVLEVLKVLKNIVLKKIKDI